MAESTRLSVKEAIQIAKMFNSKIAFQKGASGAYRFLLNRPKHFKVATKHMVNPLKHSYELIESEAKKYSQAYEFQKKSKWAYCTAQQNGWLASVCSHMDKRFLWDNPTAIKEAKKYKHLNEFRKHSRGAYNFLKKQGNEVLHRACRHMEKQFKWTEKEALKEAKKYKNKQEMRMKAFCCFAYIFRAGIADNAFAHMEEIIIQSEKIELNEFLVMLENALKKRKIDYKVSKEFHPIKGKRYRVDLLLELFSLNKKIAVEYKSDRCYWNKDKIKKQIEFYQEHLQKIGVEKTYLISTKGKYGISRDAFLKDFLKELDNA